MEEKPSLLPEMTLSRGGSDTGLEISKGGKGIEMKIGKSKPSGGPTRR